MRKKLCSYYYFRDFDFKIAFFNTLNDLLQEIYPIEIFKYNIYALNFRI